MKKNKKEKQYLNKFEFQSKYILENKPHLENHVRVKVKYINLYLHMFAKASR